MPITPLLPAAKLPLPSNWTEMFTSDMAAAANRLQPKHLQIAKAGLCRMCPPDLAPYLEELRHPLAAKAFTRPGWMRLLELGLAIELLPATEAHIKRSRKSDQFGGFMAEVQALLMVRRRAVLESPAHVVGQDRCEAIARFPDGQKLALEAKHLDLSDDARDTEPVLTNLFFEIQRAIPPLRCAVGGARATVYFSEAIKDLGNRTGVDFERLRDRVRAAAEKLASQLHRGDPFGTFELEGLGSLSVRPEPGATGVTCDAYGPPIDQALQNRRVRRVLNKALAQTSAVELDGLIILDIEHDASARNSLAFVSHWATRKDKLAAVLVVERYSLPGGSLCARADVLPGRAYEKYARNVMSLLEFCGDGHLHYSPLSRLAAPCPLTTWLS